MLASSAAPNSAPGVVTSRRLRLSAVSFALLLCALILLFSVLAGADSAVAAQPAKRATVTGELKLIIAEGYKKKRSKSWFSVAGGRREYRLKFGRGVVVRGAKARHQIGAYAKVAALTNSRVRVIGRVRGRTFTATRIIQLGSGAKNRKARSARVHGGQRTVAVISFYFPEETGPPHTNAELRTAMFTGADSFRNFWLEESGNSVDLRGRRNGISGDVFGPYRVQTTATENGDCKYASGVPIPADRDAYVAEAQAAAASQDGLSESELASYDHVIYIGTQGPNCHFVSQANGGSTEASGKDLFAFDTTLPGITIHEFGHNLGAWHANTAKCYAGFDSINRVQVPLSASCNYEEYADPYSPMGQTVTHNNGAHSARFGFFDSRLTPTIANPISGDLDIYPRHPRLPYSTAWPDRRQQVALSRCSGGADCSEIYRPGTSSADFGIDRRFISLDYRRRTGFYESLLPAGDVDGGVSLRIGPDPNSDTLPRNVWSPVPTEEPIPAINDTWLIDMTPDTATMTDGALKAGMSAYDPVSNITITSDGLSTDSGNATYASVRYTNGVATAVQGTVSLVNVNATDSELRFVAAAGHNNLIRFAYEAANHRYVASATNPDGVLAAGAGCSVVNDRTVHCPEVLNGRTVRTSYMSLGDGNDLGLIDSTVSIPANLSGSSGNDYLVGGSSGDTLYGGLGDDVLKSGSGSTDFLYGGDGTDRLYGGAGSKSLFGEGGNDIVEAVSGNGTFSGGTEDDEIRGGAGTETLTGGDGSDKISLPIRGGVSTINGGTGDDMVSFAMRTASVSVSLDNVANDGVSGENENVGDTASTSIEHIEGGVANDFLSGDAGWNFINGGRGSDTIRGHGERDMLYGGEDTVVDNLYGEINTGSLLGVAGADRFLQSPINDGGGIIDGGAGVDQVEYTERRADLTVTIGNGTRDDGEANEGDDIRDSVERIELGRGDDVLSVNPAVTTEHGFTIVGNWGADTLRGGPSMDSIFGGSGNDPVLAGQGGNDYIYGEDGNDKLWGDNDPAVSLIGTAGNDYMRPGLDADEVRGGGGSLDRVDYKERTASVNVSLDNQQNDGVSAEGDNVFDDTENVYTGSGADLLRGSSLANALYGGSGNDTAYGEGGADYLVGEDGADYMSGGDGDDQVRGSAGDDNLSGNNGGDSVFGDAEADRISGGAGDDTLDGGTGNDNVLGGNDNDTLKGGTGNDVFDGNSGVDTVDYLVRTEALNISLDGVANDTVGSSAETDNVAVTVENVIGGTGNDRIVGSSSANRIDGSAGTDVLIGNGQADALIGGLGNDTVWGDSENNSNSSVVTGADTITVKGDASFADSVDCGGQPAGTSDAVSADPLVDFVQIILGFPGYCETVTY